MFIRLSCKVCWSITFLYAKIGCVCWYSDTTVDNILKYCSIKFIWISIVCWKTYTQNCPCLNWAKLVKSSALLHTSIMQQIPGKLILQKLRSSTCYCKTLLAQHFSMLDNIIHGRRRYYQKYVLTEITYDNTITVSEWTVEPLSSASRRLIIMQSILTVTSQFSVLIKLENAIDWLA